VNVLLVYPAYPSTFWSFKHALRFVRAKAAYPPLGLLTVAAMLPDQWPARVVDLNVDPLTDLDLDWADLVLISAMMIQKESADAVVDRCRAKGVRTVAGGPLYTHLHQEIQGVDHLIVGEAEEIMPVFLEDLARGEAQPVYQAGGHPNLGSSPAPRWDLVEPRNYRSMSVQFSRGCPFDCEFCDIVKLFGRKPRLKSPAQVLLELDNLHRLGWQGNLMIVDDNFIGQKAKTKELLREIIAWQRSHHQPFNFITQASVNLADDPELLSLMAQANFDQVFLGIETPAPDSLRECHKHQNRNRDLVAAVKTIQSYGLEVMGGFIVGFDADSPSIFKDQINFIQRSGIPTAMIGLLSVIPGTRLHERVKKEGRLLGLPTGDSIMDLGGLNFIPKMGREQLIAGYRQVLSRLYEPRAYYRRVRDFLKQSGKIKVPRLPFHRPISRADLAAALRVLWRLGIRARGRRAFWRFLTMISLTRPAKLPQAMNLAATGYHLRLTANRFVETLDRSPRLGSREGRWGGPRRPEERWIGPDQG